MGLPAADHTAGEAVEERPTAGICVRHGLGLVGPGRSWVGSFGSDLCEKRCVSADARATHFGIGRIEFDQDRVTTETISD